MHVLFPPPPPPSACMAMHTIHSGGMKEEEQKDSRAFYFSTYFPSDLHLVLRLHCLTGGVVCWDHIIYDEERGCR